MLQEENLQFWEERARRFNGHEVSWGDVDMKGIEVDTISRLISQNDDVLDVGCSNGAATLELHRRTGARFLGIDYSPEAIRQAKALAAPGIRFVHMSALELDEKEAFDKAVSIRCLINILDPAGQREALRRIHAALRPGGLYIMCEAFSGALDNLNGARRFFGLAPLPVPKQNLYLDEEKLPGMIRGLFEVEGVIRHSSLYYLGTRVFQYLCREDEPRGFHTELHRFFARYGHETGRSGDFGPNKVYLLRKIAPG